MILRKPFLLLLFSFIFFEMIGQNKYVLIKNYVEDNGLASNHTYMTTQDKNGFIWISTDNGVSRFDGTKFHNYSVKEGLPANDVLQVFRDRKGKLWANTYMKPLSYFDEKLNRFVISEGNADIFNSMWTYKLGFNGNFQSSYQNTFIEIDGIPKVNQKSIGQPLYIYKNAFLTFYQLKKGALHLEITQDGEVIKKNVPITFNPIQTFYFLGSIFSYTDQNELVRFRFTKNKEIEVRTLKLDQKISLFSFTKNNINFCDQNGRIIILDALRFKVLEKIKTNSNPNSAFFDRYNNLWIATSDNGVLLYKKSAIRNIEFASSVNKDFQSLELDGDNIIGGNFTGEVYENNKLKLDIRKLKTNERSIRVLDIIKTKSNTIIISEHFIIKNFHKSIFPSKYELSAIKSSILINDTLVYLGTSNGLFRFNPVSCTITKVSPNSTRILKLEKSSTGELIFSTSNKIFKKKVDDDHIEELEISKYFKYDFITGLEAAPKNLLWVSTDRGNLYLFRNYKLIKKYTNRDGLPNNIKVIEVKDNVLWIGTHSDGLIRMDFRWKNNALYHHIQYINSQKGLAANNINAILFKKDSVVVATKNGISVLPDNFSSAYTRSGPILLQTKIDGEIVPNSKNFNLKNNQKTISFEISNVDFANNFSEMQYAIDDSTKWITLKDKTLNFQVNSNEMKIYLRSINNNRTKVGGSELITIYKEKYFYQQYWFWVVFGGALIGLIVYLNGKRVIKNQREFYEKELVRQVVLEKERERISHDMHDDLGASVTALKYQAEFLKHKIADQKLRKDVEDLIATSQEIHKSMREMLWNLKSANNTLSNFVEYSEVYALGFFKKTDITAEFIKHNIDPEISLSTETRRNLFLCMKEALNNVLKHSKAKNVTIKMVVKEDYFQMTITDDGIGIPDKNKEGNGLHNMSTRMEDINGSFKVLNSLKGTRLVFEVKI